MTFYVTQSLCATPISVMGSVIGLFLLSNGGLLNDYYKLNLIGQCNGTFPSYFCKEAERAGNESFQSSERISWNLAYAVVHIIRNKKEGWGASERERVHSTPFEILRTSERDEEGFRDWTVQIHVYVAVIFLVV